MRKYYMVVGNKIQKGRKSFEEFVAGLKRRKAFLESRGIDLNAPPTRRRKKTGEAADGGIDSDEEVTA